MNKFISALTLSTILFAGTAYADTMVSNAHPIQMKIGSNGYAQWEANGRYFGYCKPANGNYACNGEVFVTDGNRQHSNNQNRHWQQQERSNVNSAGNFFAGLILGSIAGVVIDGIANSDSSNYEQEATHPRRLRNDVGMGSMGSWQGTFHEGGRIQPTQGDNGKVARWYAIVPEPDQHAGDEKFFGTCEELDDGMRCKDEVTGLQLEN